MRPGIQIEFFNPPPSQAGLARSAFIGEGTFARATSLLARTARQRIRFPFSFSLPCHRHAKNSSYFPLIGRESIRSRFPKMARKKDAQKRALLGRKGVGKGIGPEIGSDAATGTLGPLEWKSKKVTTIRNFNSSQFPNICRAAWTQ